MPKEFNYHSEVMGCAFDLTFITKSVEKADKCFIKAKEIADFYENKFSRFNSENELSRLNRDKSIQPSPEFLEICRLAIDIHEKTKGSFNSLLQVSKIGYNKSFEDVQKNTTNKLSSLGYNSNLNEVYLNEKLIRLKPDHELDFGGFLKGYVAEKIASKLRKECNGLVVSIGGDMYTYGLNDKGRRFAIEIINPHNDDKNVNIPMLDSSLCTSGTYKRKWSIRNQQFHHILDYQTKKSADSDIVSASILHKNGSMADALATTAISLGSKSSISFLSNKDISFVIILDNGDIIKSNDLR